MNREQQAKRDRTQAHKLFRQKRISREALGHVLSGNGWIDRKDGCVLWLAGLMAFEAESILPETVQNRG